jgi:hypothetical protein
MLTTHFGTRRLIFSLLMLLFVLSASGCGAPVTSQAKPQQDPQEKFVANFERVNATIEEFSYPESSLLFAPRERPNTYEQMAQTRHNIRYNRYNRHSAIYKTADSIEKVSAYYTKRHLKMDPISGSDQRVFICCEPELRITLTKLQNGTSITIEVPSSITQPTTQLANKETLNNDN